MVKVTEYTFTMVPFDGNSLTFQLVIICHKPSAIVYEIYANLKKNLNNLTLKMKVKNEKNLTCAIPSFGMFDYIYR